MAKRILNKFKLDEISTVDRPAQVGAKMVLMKRDNLAVAKGAFVEALQELKVEQAVSEALNGLWETQSALREAICEIIEDPEEYPDQKAAITVALAEFSAEVQAMVASAAAPVAAAAGGGEPPSGGPTTKSGDDDDTTKNLKLPEEGTPMSKTMEEINAELTAQLAKAEAYGRLTDIEKAHCNSLPVNEQESFLKMDTGARANVLAKAVEANPVVYTTSDGAEFRKNDDPRLVAMAKQADENLKVAKAAQDKADTMEFEKRADGELNNLPGETAVKVALLKAINGITDEATRTQINQLIKAGNDSMAAAFEKRGTSSAPIGDANAALETLAKAYAEKHGVDMPNAYNEVLKTDEGKALYAKA